MQLRTEAKEIAPGEREVVLMVTATSAIGGTTELLVEVNHAGLFGGTGLTSDEMGRPPGSDCSSILFPHLREVVSDLATPGAFPHSFSRRSILKRFTSNILRNNPKSRSRRVNRRSESSPHNCQPAAYDADDAG